MSQKSSSAASGQSRQRTLLERLSLIDKVTVVTGGSRGIGLALAKAVAELGSHVAVLDVIEPSEDFGELSAYYGRHFRHYKTDVTAEKDLENVFARLAKDFGHIDGCITAAGIGMHKPFFDVTWEDTSKVLNLNVRGTFHCAQIASRQMRSQGTGGSIVMISSIAGHQAVPGQMLSIYNASKAGVRMLAQALGVELAPWNIRVNSISPGFIFTDMTKDLADTDPQLWDMYNRTPPLGRIGQRDDLVLAVAYLLGDGASYTTGVDIPITGGLHAGRIFDRYNPDTET